MCLFCDKYKNKENIRMENDTMFCILDGYPVNFGHTLIISKECKKDYFELTYEEIRDMNELIKNAKSMMDVTISPDGYNIGMNCGEFAGQTIHHFHAHLIPRFKGDVSEENLKGGIRNFKKPLREYI